MIRTPGAVRICVTGVGVAVDPRDAAIAACARARLEGDAVGGRHRAVELGIPADRDDPQGSLAHALASAVGASGSVRWASGDLSGIASLSRAMDRIREGPERVVVAGGVGSASAVFILEGTGAAGARRAVPLASVLAVRSGWDQRIAVEGSDAEFDPIDAARVFRQALGDAHRKAAELALVLSCADGLPAGAAERAVRRALGHLEDRVPIEQQVGPDSSAGAGFAAEALKRIVDGGANLIAAQAFSAQGATVVLVLERPH